MPLLRACALPAFVLAALIGAKAVGPSSTPSRRSAAAPLRRVFSLTAPPACPRRLPQGGRDVYEIELPADQYLHVAFEQQGADIVVDIFPPGRSRLDTIDSLSLNGEHGFEEVHLVSTAAGRYRLEVTSTSETAGNYCPRFHEVRRPTAQDRVQAAADRDLYAGSAPGRATGEAEARYRRAIPLFEKVGDRWHQAVTLFLLAGLVGEGGHSGEAIGLLNRAETLFQAAGDRYLVIHSLSKKGGFYKDLLDFPHAVEAYQSDVSLAEPPNFNLERATALHQLGFLYQVEGEPWQALGAFRQAIELWRQLPGTENRENEANSRTGLGWVYASTGDWQRALAAHREALALRKRDSSPDKDKRAISDIQIGSVLRHIDPSLALVPMRKAWQLQTEAHSGPHDRAATLDGMGRIYADLGHSGAQPERRTLFLKAQAQFQQALNLYAGDPTGEASTSANLGEIALDLGEPEEARRSFERALALAPPAKNLLLEVRALSGLAEAAFQSGDLSAAQRQAEAALDRCERLRAAAVRTDLQTSYLAANVSLYNLLVRILMEQDRRQPGKGYYRQAFERSEQTRARALLDALHESGDRQAGVPGDLLAQRLKLREEINAIARQRGRPDNTSTAAASLERRLSERLDRLYEINAEINRRRGSVSLSSPNFTWQLARQLLDPDTLLLEYSLGKQSYLWVVSAGGVQSFDLPASDSDKLEQLLRSAAEMLASQQKPDDKTLRRLSNLLLGPVAGQLRGKRLLIAADGGAQYLPFGALPDPSAPPGPPRPLLMDHEIDYVPSLAVLAKLQERKKARAPAPLPLAVLADPVFSSRDERLLPFVGTDDGEPFLPRLRASRDEAKAIARLLPAGQVYKALDFEASRELVTRGKLGSYRILHFAAHGELRTDHPELSALVFSRWDRQGRAEDGALRVSDLQGVDLPADLVVLSACSTALGRETPGEGLVGLPQAFLTAGASRVLVSLWQVEDYSTAALMTGFYRRVLAGHQPPGQALREAQLEVRADPRWGAPYYWAGFVLQGDWR